jgi:DNA helicase-2/ATP-dependent DNA helicase PcrA
MSIKNHKDFKIEVKRLEETKDYLESAISLTMENRIRYNSELMDAYQNLDYQDSSQNYASIILNTTLLDNLEKNFDLLIHGRKKPYFARIDIKQDEKHMVENLYIGKVSLFDSSMETPLVVDWRAPISSVYYDGRIGKTIYQVDNKEIEIELLNKRQYTIENGDLIDFMDVDISTSDTFLQASLNSHASDRLKDIVSTIQSEQNTIIRADISKPLIVQGVAGSGKTTIALHRIAYLLYTYEKVFTPDEFMIIAPNSLFLDYISNVLPELGANKVIQTTYVDLMRKIIGKNIEISDINLKLNELLRTDVNAKVGVDKELILASSLIKNSMKIKELLDLYLEEIENELQPKNDLVLHDITILKVEDIKELFFKTYSFMPYVKRISNIKKYISKKLNEDLKEIVKETENKYLSKMHSIKIMEKDSISRKKKLVILADEREEIINIYKEKSKKTINEYMKSYKLKDILYYFNHFINEIDKFNNETSLKDVVMNIRNMSINGYEIEDLAAIVYLNEEIYGTNETKDIKMVVIDEAQDFGDFQFFVLRKVLKTDRFTILGDLSQGIHEYRAIKDWKYVKNNIFNVEANYLTLEQSYRTTIEIMHEANRVLKNLKDENIVLAKPVVRHGKKPDFKEFTDVNEMINNIINHINSWQSEKLTTIALITKTSQEALYLYSLLNHFDELNIALINEKTVHFNHKILVIPAHLSKGLEFDGVIVTSIFETYNYSNVDIKLMYVAMTRAMHRLSIFYLSKMLPYFD